MRSDFRNTALSSLQGVSLAASSALSCKNHPRKSFVYFQSRISINFHISERETDRDFWQKHGITRILTVDDEEVICQNVQMAMENVGVSADYALDGQTALNMAVLAEREERPYSVILIDWKMPGIDGVDTKS